MSILVLHGPNLNLLGTREPEIYGKATLEQIDADISKMAADAGKSLQSFQTNHEGELIERIHTARRDGTRFIVINAGAWTHTSVALRDALVASELPFVEVHLSNIYQREAFRHHSYLADKAAGVVCGLGPLGYRAAVEFALQRL